MKQLILHIPHSSTNIPFKDGYIVSDEILNQEILKLTDWYTDELFHSSKDILIRADFSRIFCDPERFTDDEQEVMAKFGMGVLYEKNDEGEIIRKVDSELRERILSEYYWKHHDQFSQAVKNQLNQFDTALIIDCHSYPNAPLKRDLNKDADRPDFNIGTDSFHTPQKLIDISEEFFKEKGYSLGIDWPYAGSIVPLEFYRQNDKVNTLMLEINRKLYLNEPTNEKSENFQEIQKVTHEFLNVMRDSF